MTEQKLGRWLTNIEPDNEQYKDYIAAHLIGPPKAAEKYTVEQLKELNIVGIYAKPED